MSATIASTPAPRSPSAPLPWVVFAIWLGVTAMSFWFFELRFQRASSSGQIAIFESEANIHEAEEWLRQLIDTGAGKLGAQATVVHVTQAGCPCSRYADPHLNEIQATYATRGVGFVRASGTMPRWIETTPAVLVYDSTGRLVYLGPYSDSAWCGIRGGFVERTLDELLKGGSPQPQRTITRGCFCSVKPS